MTSRLKLGSLLDDKAVRLNVELPAAVHRDLVAYADVLGRETGQANEPAKLIAPMLARFMAADRAFARARRQGGTIRPSTGANAGSVAVIHPPDTHSPERVESPDEHG